MTEPESLGDIMASRSVPSFRGKRRKLELLKINWRRIAGDREGEHSSPTRLARRTLTVSADGPSWAAELSIQTAVLLKGIEAVIGKGDVQKIRIQAKTEGARPGERGVKLAGAEENPDGGECVVLGAEVKGELESIGQAETRNALERLLKASVASKQGKPDGR